MIYVFSTSGNIIENFKSQTLSGALSSNETLMHCGGIFKNIDNHMNYNLTETRNLIL